MAATLETVVKQLEDSGIVAPGKLENFIPPKANPKSVEELVRELVKQNHLTKFQAQQVALGKAKSLIVGEYTILDKIGAGGMGQVFKALHRRMERTVAIKMLPTAMTKDAAALARFQREVVAAAKLSHPNIVAAFDAGQAGSVHFLVMEYVEGTDLSALVKKHGPIDGSKALNYLLQAAKGLEYAHKKGVIHRDIKPANLLLDTEGTVKILDMGLARIEVGGNQATQAELTGTGAVMGTVDYMSPEQAFNTKYADARADIYSLGCTLYYLLAGKCVYDGETIIEKILGHREKPIPKLPLIQARSVSEGLEVGGQSSEVGDAVQALFEKMVAKKAEDRYQTMTEVIAALEKAIAGQSAPTSLAPPAESTDTGLTKFFQQMPGATTHKSKPTKATPPASSFNRKPEASASPVSPAKPNPKLLLYGSLAGGILSLLGIPLVLYFALSGGGAKPPKLKPTGGTTGAPVVGASTAGSALEFDGDSRVEIPTLSYEGNTPLTLEATVRPAAGNPDAGVLLIYGKQGYAKLQMKTYGWHAHAPQSSGFVARSNSSAVGKLTRVAAVWDGARLRLFVDGKAMVDVEPHRVSGSQITSGTVLGNWGGPSTNRGLRGQLDEVRISKTARYTADYAPPDRLEIDEHTLALYHFDEGTGDQLLDSSPNKHHGQIVGAKWVQGIAGGPSAATTGSSSSAGSPQEAWLDLLPLVNERTDVPAGLTPWERVAGSQTLKSPIQSKARIGVPVIPAGDYHLQVVAAKTSDKGDVSLILPAGSGRVRMSFDAYPELGGRSGLDLGNLALSNPGNPTARAGHNFLDKQPHTIDAIVRTSGSEATIEVDLDGKPIVRWTGPQSELRAMADVIANDGKTPALGAWSSVVEFREARLRMLTGEARDLRTGTVLMSAASNPQSAIGNPQSLTPYEILTSPDYVWSEPVSLGPVVNSEASESGPFLTADGLTLLFESDRSGGVGKNDLWQCRRATLAAPWSPPENLGPIVNSDAQERAPSVSADGLTLVFSSDRERAEGSYQLFLCTRQTTAQPWSPPQRMGSGGDTEPELSADGLAVLFHSSRAGGQGGEDLWMYRRNKATDAWGPFENLGSVVNSSKREFACGLSSDSRVLLFSSDRDGGLGRPDMWLSSRASPAAPWSAPINLGAPVNTPSDDLGPTLSADGSTLIFRSNRPGILGKANLPDLWMSRRVRKPVAATPTPYEILTSPDYEWTEPENLGPAVNSTIYDANPSLSADGLTLLFDSMRPGGPGNSDLWMCRRPSLAAPWSPAELVGSNVNWNSGERQPALSADGLTLLLSSDRSQTPGQFALWQYTRKSTADPWSGGKKLDAAGQAAGENYGGPEMSSDGLALFFYAHNRPGRQGSSDLWVSRRQAANDPWGAAENLGPGVNSTASDYSPALSSDGCVLLFSSDRQDGSQGKRDLWMCSRPSPSDPWSTPHNLGQPVNTAATEGDSCLSADGTVLIFNCDRTGGQGGTDLWMSRRVLKAK